MDRIRVLIVDDNVRLRWSVMEALVEEESLEIVDEASDGNEAVEKARDLKPDLVLMDLYMPDCDGVEATRQLQAEMPDMNILMFTVSEAEADLVSALKAGARGYLLKNERPEQIVQAIHYVARGGLLVSPSMATKLIGEIKMREPAVEGVAGGTRARLPAEAEVAIEAGDKPIVEQAAGEPPEDTGAPAPEMAESVVSMPAAVPEALVSEANLVLSPPLEPTVVLKLHQWLKEDAKGDVSRITASWGGETVISVEFREPVPLLRMLAELPELAEVVEEPYVEEMVESPDGLTSQSEQKTGGYRPALKQFRLAFKAV